VGKLVRFRQSDDETLVLTARDVAIFGQSLNYFISSYNRSAASDGSGLAGKSGRKTANICDPSARENEYEHSWEFPARRLSKSIVFHHSSPRFASPSSQNSCGAKNGDSA
jgi:hypothetical protein